MNFNNYLKLNLKNKIIISILIFIIALAALIWFIVLPTVGDIKKMGDDIEAQRVDLEKKYIKGQSLKKLSENLKIIEPQLNKLDQIFINSNRELEFITKLEEIANANAVTQKINLGAASKDTGGSDYQIMPLQLFTQGTFGGQINYLKKLESLNYYINIKSIELSAATAQIIENNENASKSTISIVMSADTFWK